MASAVGTNFHFKQFNFEFLDQIYLKGHFLSKTKKKKKKKKKKLASTSDFSCSNSSRYPISN